MNKLSAVSTIAVVSMTFRVGDCLLLLPFLCELRRRFPKKHITWVAEAGCAYHTQLRPLVAPFLDDVIAHTHIGEVTDTPIHWPADKDPHFDLVISIRTKRRLNRPIIELMRPDIFIAADYTYGWRAMSYQFSRKGRFKRPKHHCERALFLLDYVRPLRPEDGPPLKPDLSPWQPLAEKLLPPGPRYMGFAPGAGVPIKRWPLERFINMARHVQEQGYTPVFIVGPQEHDMLPAIRTALPDVLLPEYALTEAEAPLNSPMLAGALAERMELALCNDSGNAHILALGKVPLIVMFHPNYGVRKHCPQLEHIIVLRAENYAGWWRRFRNTDIVMDDLPEQAVRDAFERLRHRLEQ